MEKLLLAVTEIHTAQPLMPKPSHFEVEIATAKFREYKLPGTDEIPAELIQAGGETSIKPLTLFGIRKNLLSSGRSLLLYQFTRRTIKPTAVIIEAYLCY
jgi:hypothetical protein